MKKLVILSGLLVVLVCSSTFAAGEFYVISRDEGLILFKNIEVFKLLEKFGSAANAEGDEGPANDQHMQILIQKFAEGEILHLPKDLVLELGEKQTRLVIGKKYFDLYLVRPEGSKNQYLAVIMGKDGDYIEETTATSSYQPLDFVVAKEGAFAYTTDVYYRIRHLLNNKEEEKFGQLCEASLKTGEMKSLPKGTQVQVFKKDPKGSVGLINIGDDQYWVFMHQLIIK